MAEKLGNIFRTPSGAIEEEVVEALIETGKFRLERIVSKGQQTPPGEWYDQDRAEWVVMLTGNAHLRFEDTEELVKLAPGDFLNIAAHRRHRVEWTDPDEPTVWLALHYDE